MIDENNMAQSNEQSLLGHVVSGSLRDGIEIRMGNQVSVEDIKEGTYVTIHGQRKSFFGLYFEHCVFFYQKFQYKR